MEIIRRTAEGTLEAWLPSTLDRLGKLEKDLEDVLASHPGLLRVESVRTGIRGPFAVFRQLSFSTPQGRSIAPDITMLAASGSPVIVEVKRFVNPELRDRQVISQVWSSSRPSSPGCGRP